MGGAAIPIISAVATFASVSESRKTRKQAQARADTARRDAQEQVQKIEKENKNKEARKSAVKDRQRAVVRQQGERADSAPKGGTLLTGGNETAVTIGGAAPGAKTLLGL